MLLGAKAHRGAPSVAPAGPRLRRSRSSLPSIDFYAPASGQQQQAGMEGYSEVLDMQPVAEDVELNDDTELVGHVRIRLHGAQHFQLCRITSW